MSLRHLPWNLENDIEFIVSLKWNLERLTIQTCAESMSSNTLVVWKRRVANVPWNDRHINDHQFNGLRSIFSPNFINGNNKNGKIITIAFIGNDKKWEINDYELICYLLFYNHLIWSFRYDFAKKKTYKFPHPAENKQTFYIRIKANSINKM